MEKKGKSYLPGPENIDQNKNENFTKVLNISRDTNLQENLITAQYEGINPSISLTCKRDAVPDVDGFLHRTENTVLSDLSIRNSNKHSNNVLVIGKSSCLRGSENVAQKRTDKTKGNTNPVHPLIWSCCLGSIEVCFMFCWVTINTLIFGFFESKTEEMVENIAIEKIMCELSLLVLVNLAHAASFFKIVEQIGALGSALLKGVQAVTVVAIGALIFCRNEKSQCLNTTKALSASLVIFGTIGYAAGGNEHSNGLADTAASTRKSAESAELLSLLQTS